VTDDHGVAWIPLSSGLFLEEGAAVRAVHGDDRAVILVDPRTSLGPQHLRATPGAAPPAADAWEATVFTDRGICRPGETIHAKTVLRANVGGSFAAPSAGDVRFLLFGPSGQAPLDERLVALSPFGTAATDFPVDGAAGTYRVEVRVPGQEEPAGSTSFQVGEYRPPALRVDLSTPSAHLDDRDRLRVDVTARYFFGPPAAGMSAHWTLVREPGGAYPGRWEGYTFGPADAASRRATVAAGDLALDAAGQASVETAIALGAPLREDALFEVTVRDTSGAGTTARRRVHAYPATFEVGLRRARQWIDHGDPLEVEAVVIDHEGAPRAGRAVEARILREGWHTYWEWSGHDRDGDGDGEGEAEGRFQPRRSRRAEVVHRCRLTSAALPVGCAWTADRPGTYVLEATTKDDRGRTSTASQRVYVAGPDEHPDRDPPGTALTLTPARGTLEVGETAEVAFESPFPEAEALLVVEREGAIVTEERRVSAGGNVFRFAVTAAMVPNAFVSLSLVRPRTGAPGHKVDLDAPDLRVGLVEIEARPSRSPLSVAIEAAGDSAPADSDVPVTVKVRDGEGQGVAAEVALFAVDEGTLRVTGYSVPDPIADLFPRRPAAFAWEDLRRSLVSRVEPPLPPGAGGDGDSRADRSRPRDEQERFDPTPLWLAHLDTDPAGDAAAVLHLPPRPAQYRLMAVAIDGGIRAGSAQRSIVASMPLVVRPVLPSFVTSGDRFLAVAFVHNTEDAPADVTVTPLLGGLPRPPQAVHLPGNGEARIAEWVDAGPAGAIAVRFEARSDRAATAVEKRVPIEPRGRTVRAESTFAVSGSREVTIALPGSAEAGSRMALTVAAHPFVGFDTSLEALLTSRDAGTEPTAASLIGLAAYAALDTGKRPGSVGAAEILAQASSAIERLTDLQGQAGGFGAHAAADGPDGYLSAYALHALLSARRAGFPVPQAPIDRAVAFEGQLARGNELLDDGRHDDLAFALRVLADGGARDDDRNRALFDQRDRLSPFGLAQLGMALAPVDRRRDTLVVDAATRVLATPLEERTNPGVLRWYEGSARTFGAVLEAALESEVAPALAAPLAGKILALRAAPDAAWMSTHETSHALAALAAYAATLSQGQPVAPRVALDGAPIAPDEEKPALVHYALPESAGRGTHTLRIEVQGTAYFALSAHWVVPLGADDDTARGEEAALHRVLEDPTGKPLGPGAHIKLGDLVRVRLFLHSEHPIPPYVAVHDPLAGGLEPVDAAHETSPRESLWALLGMGPDEDVDIIDARGHYAAKSLDSLARRTFLPDAAVFHLDEAGTGLREYTYGVRATTPGTFVLPPAEISALYAPRFAARSAAAAIVVDP
jgi:uncharacterized protein YfaS (alpha-2-macroglobulin family)